MRRVLLLSFALAALLIPTGPASADSDQDVVAGTGQIVAGPIDVFVHINAQSGPSGENPRGHLVLRAVPPAVPFPIDIEGRITCMRVQGNAATVGFEVTKSKDPAIIQVGNGGYFSFVDNGEPGTNDKFEGFPIGFPPTFCIPPFASRTVTNGNYIVHDASP